MVYTPCSNADIINKYDLVKKYIHTITTCILLDKRCLFILTVAL